jgi:hypothetical protein
MTSDPRPLATRSGPIAALAWLAASALLVSLALGQPAAAQSTEKAEGEFVAYDAAAGTLQLRITDAGGDAKLARGQVVTFAVKPAGSVLDKTAVTSRGARADLSQVAEGQQLSVYWQRRPGAGEGDVRFAKRVDVVPASD